MPDEHTEIRLMQQDLKYIKKAVEGILKKLDDDYVTKDQFDPVKKIVYGLVSLILIGVVGAVIALVVK